ncbi:OmpA family protein [Segetibacter sp. 3557_3]|uniref:OmpA family protein n=1 Tax=Segetibacter sp. 3557_3 TaxID=2547429 RepID=UPI0010587613|nr:OmpA family protein [Segetibacter sp. 3557_3]TDH20053.1 OmpA family protein [Segetibacter sp. 3557_3]
MASRFLIIFLFLATAAGAQTTIVHFDFNSSVLTRETREVLNDLIASRNIRSLGIFGHTDQMGSDPYNEWLSLKRARAVKDYLVSRGVKENMIGVVRGFGAERLISNQDDSLSRQLNRRVVLMNNYTVLASDSAVAARQSTLTAEPSRTTADSITKTNAPGPTPGLDIVKRPEPVVKQQRNEKLIEDIKDKNTRAGENIVLKNINFLPGSHQFLEGAYSSLNDLLETMQKVPTLEVEIQGHVCCQDGETDALDNATGELALSVNRARAVHDYLVEKGIQKSRLSYKGLAHQFPLINPEVTEADRVANRRVEIKIIKK